MIIKTVARAISKIKPVIIKKNGTPRFVILDWDTYRSWEERREDMEDHIRFEVAERESRGKKRHTLAEIKKKYHIFS